MPRRLDSQDLRILRALTENARISWSDLAEKVGLSVTPTVRRVHQMEAEGLIKGYGARLDEAQLVGELPVFIAVTMERQVKDALARFEELTATMPEVMAGHLVSGRQDYVLQAFVRDMSHYQDLLGRLTEIDGIAHIQSTFVLKSFLTRQSPLLDNRLLAQRRRAAK